MRSLLHALSWETCELHWGGPETTAHPFAPSALNRPPAGLLIVLVARQDIEILLLTENVLDRVVAPKCGGCSTFSLGKLVSIAGMHSGTARTIGIK